MIWMPSQTYWLRWFNLILHEICYFMGFCFLHIDVVHLKHMWYTYKSDEIFSRGSLKIFHPIYKCIIHVLDVGHLCAKITNLWNNDFWTISIIELWDGKLCDGTNTYKFCNYFMHVYLLVDFLFQIDMHIPQVDWFLIVSLLIFKFQVDMHLASWLVSWL
jgi:hypothetical protein